MISLSSGLQVPFAAGVGLYEKKLLELNFPVELATMSKIPLLPLQILLPLLITRFLDPQRPLLAIAYVMLPAYGCASSSLHPFVLSFEMLTVFCISDNHPVGFTQTRLFVLRISQLRVYIIILLIFR